MKIKQFILAGLVGGIVHFFLGWLVYGILFMNTMQEHTNQALYRKSDEMIFWSISLGSIFLGFLLSYFLIKLGSNSPKSGFRTGAILGLLMSASISFTSYGTSVLYNDLYAVYLDIIGGAFVVGLTGMIVGLYLRQTNQNKKLY